jgi:hypothetical protein
VRIERLLCAWFFVNIMIHHHDVLMDTYTSSSEPRRTLLALLTSSLFAFTSTTAFCFVSQDKSITLRTSLIVWNDNLVITKQHNLVSKTMTNHHDGGFLDRDDVPNGKEFHTSTRQNSQYKWQTKHVVGALEIECQPDLNLRGQMTPQNSNVLRSDKFEEAQAAFDELGLRDSFIEAAEGFPKETCCCGLIQDDQKTIKYLAPHLNKTWGKEANIKLKPKGYKVDCFNWSWNNISGSSETHILLIRFHELAVHNLEH